MQRTCALVAEEIRKRTRVENRQISPARGQTSLTAGADLIRDVVRGAKSVNWRKPFYVLPVPGTASLQSSLAATPPPLIPGVLERTRGSARGSAAERCVSVLWF